MQRDWQFTRFITMVHDHGASVSLCQSHWHCWKLSSVCSTYFRLTHTRHTWLPVELWIRTSNYTYAIPFYPACALVPSSRKDTWLCGTIQVNLAILWTILQKKKHRIEESINAATGMQHWSSILQTKTDIIPPLFGGKKWQIRFERPLRNPFWI